MEEPKLNVIHRRQRRQQAYDNFPVVMDFLIRNERPKRTGEGEEPDWWP